jgi:hypothetical protein
MFCKGIFLDTEDSEEGSSYKGNAGKTMQTEWVYVSYWTKGSRKTKDMLKRRTSG